MQPEQCTGLCQRHWSRESHGREFRASEKSPHGMGGFGPIQLIWDEAWRVGLGCGKCSCPCQGIALDKPSGPLNPNHSMIPISGQPHQAHRNGCRGRKRNQAPMKGPRLAGGRHQPLEQMIPGDQQLLPGCKGHSLSPSSALQPRHCRDFMAVAQEMGLEP